MSHNSEQSFPSSKPGVQLERYCLSIGAEIGFKELQQFGRYIEILEAFNRHTNITRISGAQDIVSLHFIDSLSLINCVDLPNRKTLLDVGSGGGFPGIPLKIVCPWLEITLLDSSSKRVSFLNTVIEDLQLKGIRAIHSRAEELAHDCSYREKFAVVTARALAPLNILVELILPFVEVLGVALAQKGPKLTDEIQGLEPTIEMLGGKVSKTHSISVSDSTTDGQAPTRNVLEIIKTESTPKGYPRKMSLIKKKPLG